MSRRNTELLLLIASAFPVILLYAMYVLTAGATISFETLAVPIGLFAAFAAAHIAVRILAGMRGRQAGDVLNNMEAKKAAGLTEMLTKMQLPPQGVPNGADGQ